MSSLPTETDVLVIGSGAAGLTAALEARLHPSTPSVLLIDACNEEWAGGNSYFTAGAYRTCHGGLDDLAKVVSNVTREENGHQTETSQEEIGVQKGEESLKDGKPSSNDTVPISLIDLQPYTSSDFHADMQRVTSGRCDPALTATLVNSSWETVNWLHDVGKVDFQLSFRRQAYRVGGRYKFWGGLALTVNGGGKGLVTGLLRRVKEAGVHVYYNVKCTGLIMAPLQSTRVVGTRVQYNSISFTRPMGEDIAENLVEAVIHSKATVLCAGGFEASSSLRSKYLGTGWASAHVRGTPFNDGSLLSISQRDCSALPVGDWAGCHAVAWDADAPWERGDREVTNEFTKSGYPLGVMVNIRGERFVDEGVDLRNYTYAKFGRAILEQERGECFQIWDGKTVPLLRDEEYRVERVKRYTAENIEDLATQLSRNGLEEPNALSSTIHAFNQAIDTADQIGEHKGKAFDPSIRDGICTSGLPLPKSNWALKLDTPPFVAVKVGSGITFTFGGIKVNPENAAVIRSVKKAIGTQEISQGRGPFAHRGNPLRPPTSVKHAEPSDSLHADSSAEQNPQPRGQFAHRSTPLQPPPPSTHKSPSNSFNSMSSPPLSQDQDCRAESTLTLAPSEGDKAPSAIESQEVKFENLFCAGEMLGGLFWGNYPGGSGLTSGAVWGRKAGRGAVKAAS